MFYVSPQLFPIMSQIDPTHTLPSYFLNIHFNGTLYMQVFQVVTSLQFLTKILYIWSIPCMLHACTFHFPWFSHPNNICDMVGGWEHWVVGLITSTHIALKDLAVGQEQVTPWCQAFFEKQLIVQLLKNYPNFYPLLLFWFWQDDMQHWVLEPITSTDIALKDVTDEQE